MAKEQKKRGRKKAIETPAIMWDLFKQYAKETKDNPRIQYDYVGRNGDKVAKPLEVPLTMCGFELFVADNSTVDIIRIEQYFSNYEKRYTEFVGICRAIRAAIRKDQIEGGMVGQYNPSITQRLNSLHETTHTTVTEQPLFTDPEA